MLKRSKKKKNSWKGILRQKESPKEAEHKIYSQKNRSEETEMKS